MVSEETHRRRWPNYGLAEWKDGKSRRNQQEMEQRVKVGVVISPTRYVKWLAAPAMHKSLSAIPAGKADCQKAGLIHHAMSSEL